MLAFVNPNLEVLSEGRRGTGVLDINKHVRTKDNKRICVHDVYKKQTNKQQHQQQQNKEINTAIKEALWVEGY